MTLDYGRLGAAPLVTLDVVTLDQVVRWTAAVGDFTPLHYDADEAAARGFDGPVVNGPWKSALVMQVLQDWVSDRGTVESLECRYEKADVVGGSLAIRVSVTGREVDGVDEVVACDLWIEDGDGRRTLSGSARLRVRPATTADDGPLPLGRLSAVLRVGEPSGTFTYRVDPNDVARFRSAVSGRRDHAAVAGEPAPPTFYAALDPVERRDLDVEKGVLATIPYAMTGGGNAFNEVSYDRPIRVGDVVTVTTTYSDVYVRQGRSGTLLFRVRTNTLADADGDRIGTTRMGHVLAFDVTEAAS
jgi:acyl dehydratase